MYAFSISFVFFGKLSEVSFSVIVDCLTKLSIKHLTVRSNKCQWEEMVSPLSFSTYGYNFVLWFYNLFDTTNSALGNLFIKTALVHNGSPVSSITLEFSFNFFMKRTQTSPWFTSSFNLKKSLWWWESTWFSLVNVD